MLIKVWVVSGSSFYDSPFTPLNLFFSELAANSFAEDWKAENPMNRETMVTELYFKLVVQK